MTGRRLRVGLAGAGWVAGDRHLPSLQARPDVDVVAIYDRNHVRAEALAARAGSKGRSSPEVHDDLDSFLALGLDVVHVTSSPWSHHDLAVAALGAGAHVFTEKPMAMNSAEAEAMVAKAREADRLLCVSHNFLFSHAMVEAKRRLGGVPVDYAMGLQLSAGSRRLPEWYRGLPGGLMFDEAPHMLYTLTDLLGGGLSLDHARASFDGAGHPKIVEVLVRGRTGSGQVTMVFCSAVSEWHLMASAATRVVGLDLFRDIAVDLPPDRRHGPLDIARSSLSAVGGHVGGFARAGARWVRHRQYWGHDVLIGLFLDAVQEGGAVPVPVTDALNVVQLTDELLASLGIGSGKRDS